MSWMGKVREAYLRYCGQDLGKRGHGPVFFCAVRDSIFVPACPFHGGGPEKQGGPRRTVSAGARAPAFMEGKETAAPDEPGARQYGQASRPISTARLCASPRLHLRPIDLVFSQGASGGLIPRGSLISWRASRLDAFSGYPSRTWVPSAYPWQDNWHARGPSTPVLSY